MKPHPQNENLAMDLVKDGTYRIDSDGKIWRCKVTHKRNGQLVSCVPRRAEHPAARGYLGVPSCHRKRGARTPPRAAAHRLVWVFFNGPIPQGLTINHKDGDCSNNSPDNLELATYSEQQLHANNVLGTGSGANQNGEDSHRAKISARDVVEIKRRRANGEMLSSIAKDYGICFQQVSRIALGKRWKKQRNGS